MESWMLFFTKTYFKDEITLNFGGSCIALKCHYDQILTPRFFAEM